MTRSVRLRRSGWRISALLLRHCWARDSRRLAGSIMHQPRQPPSKSLRADGDAGEPTPTRSLPCSSYQALASCEPVAEGLMTWLEYLLGSTEVFKI
ncbi:hypothetical protein BDW62DRAFT_177134 [Aspergillus aurantiobrunneus]